MTDWYAGAYAPAYQSVIYTEWLSGMQGAYQTVIHIVVSPDDGHIVARNIYSLLEINDKK